VGFIGGWGGTLFRGFLSGGRGGGCFVAHYELNGCKIWDGHYIRIQENGAFLINQFLEI